MTVDHAVAVSLDGFPSVPVVRCVTRDPVAARPHLTQRRDRCADDG